MNYKRILQLSLVLLAIIIVVGVFTVLTEGPSTLAGLGEEKKSTIGFVDIQLVFQQHPEKFKAEKILSEEAQRLQAKLEEEATELSAQEREQLLESYQRELMEMEQELVETVIGEIDATITEIAREREVAVVLESRNVIYGGQDLTREVLEKIREAVQSEE